MIDPEIKAFGQRILVWVEKMRPLAEMSDKAFACKKWKGVQKENEKA